MKAVSRQRVREPVKDVPSQRTRPRKTGAQVGRLLSGPPTQIWKSRISWRITLVVFLTIMAVQAGILSMTVRDYESARLSELAETGRSAIAPLVSSRITDMLSSPISDEGVERLFASTRAVSYTHLTLPTNREV